MSRTTFDIITIFPEIFNGPFSQGMVYQAQKRGLVEIRFHFLRDYTSDRHKTIDDRPFGGGEGMVLKPEPLFAAIRKLQKQSGGENGKVVLLTPQGRQLNHEIVQRYSAAKHMVLVRGRYEGVDERVNESLVDDEISIGDYVLSGGELAACVFVEAVTRLIPGVLNNSLSTLNESFSGKSNLDYCTLDYPHYTRPEIFEGHAVPQVLLSGDHEKIRLWRRKKALEKTLKNRPDLIKYDLLSEADKRLLE